MNIKVTFRPMADGSYVALVSVPTRSDEGDHVGALHAAAQAPSKAEALVRAATMAERIMNDPVMAALIPPQAQAAIAAAKELGSAAKVGAHALRSLWGRLHGPGKRRLAASLAMHTT